MSVPVRMVTIFPSGRLRARKMSPLGATRSTRAPCIPVTRASTENPGIVLSVAFAGLGTTFDRLAVEGVSPGAGRSAGVILRITPGASVRQSPYASEPVRTL